MATWKCTGYIDVRIPVWCEVEADTEDDATEEGCIRFGCREDLHEDESVTDVNESQVEKVERVD